MTGGPDWGPDRRVLALGLALLAPSLLLALGVGWLWEELDWWSVNHPLLAWRWAVGWVLLTMALSVLVGARADGRGPPVTG